MTTIPSANLHDSYFRDWISEPGVLADYLRHYLPQHIVALIDPSTANIEHGSFVDDELRQQLTDVLCTVKLRSGSDVFIYCLIEHKSYPDSMVAFQLLRYMVHIWQRQMQKGATKLTPIISMVLYHGEKQWNIPTQFAILFGDLGQQVGFIPQFNYYLTDLSQMPDEQIHGQIITRVGLLGMKYSRNPHANKILVRVMALLSGIGDRKLAQGQLIRLLKYVTSIGNNWERSDVQTAIAAAETDPNLQEVIMSNFAKELIERGMEIGEQRGLQIGEQRGIQATIARLIERKLGPLQANERERIAQLSEASQLSLADALVDGLMTTYADLVKRLTLLN
ncbi:MAG: Rpn family recombination-promoting nuclease/putative transposase [Chloroflexota bacterium]|nr:Rpn family recombination-promoting nuclease/putative transposase [Chloroflexota bacterium]